MLHPTVFYAEGATVIPTGAGHDAELSVEVAMQWNDSYQEQVLCFTNIPRPTVAPTSPACARR